MFTFIKYIQSFYGLCNVRVIRVLKLHANKMEPIFCHSTTKHSLFNMFNFDDTYF